LIKYCRLSLLTVLCVALVSGLPCCAAIRSSRLEVGLLNGTLVSVKNLLTGESYTSGESGKCFAGVYAVDGKTRMLSDTKNVASRSDGKSISQSAFWDSGVASWASDFKFDPSGDLIINQTGKSSAKGVYGISWGIAGIPDSLTVLVPGESGQRFGADAPYGIRSFDYPYAWEAPFVIIQGKQGGVIVYAEDPALHFKTLFVEHADHSFRIRLESRNQAPFDELTSIKSVEWRMRAYKGPWQSGAAVYRKWMVSQLKPIPKTTKQPSWAKDIQLLVTCGMDINTLIELAKHVDPHKTILYIAEWRRDGYDHNYPDYTARPEFENFVELAHKIGYRVMAHANYFGCDPRNPMYAKLSKYQLRDPFTKELQFWSNPLDQTISVAYINPASKLWREIFISKMKELVDKYHVDALHIDQTWVNINDANGLIDGMSSVQGNIQLHKELHAALPQIAISGEGLNEVTCIYESFCQRHEMAIDTFTGTWNNLRLAQAHPISSYILAPYTTMLGLWLPNPDDNPSVFMAWRRAYEQYGVIPTLPYPRVEQLKNPTPLIASIINDACFFQKYQPVADFESTWKPTDIFRYNLNDGRKAFYRKDSGVIFGTEDKNGKIDVLFRRISGVGHIKIGGSIPDWLAYNEKEIIGLDPQRDYVWSEKPRYIDAVHIVSISPGDYILSQTDIKNGSLHFILDNRLNAISLCNFNGDSSCGVMLTSGGERKYSGISFIDESGGRTQTEGENIFVHPPWKSTSKTLENSVGRTFMEFNLNLPIAQKITFSAGVSVKKEVVGKSDGITLVAAVSDGIDSLKDSINNDKAEPAILNLDLTKFAGKHVKLRMEIDPGPAGSPLYDLGMLNHPVISFENSQPGSVEIQSKMPISSVLAAHGKSDFTKMDDNTYRINADLPNNFTVLIPGLQAGNIVNASANSPF